MAENGGILYSLTNNTIIFGSNTLFSSNIAQIGGGKNLHLIMLYSNLYEFSKSKLCN